jgi:hypothetical protein
VQKEPSGQGAHAEIEVAFATSPYEPAAHAVHCASVVIPTLFDQVPAGHGVIVVASEQMKPDGQGVLLVDPLGQYDPIEHGLEVAEGSPGQKKPTAHGKQNDALASPIILL